MCMCMCKHMDRCVLVSDVGGVVFFLLCTGSGNKFPVKDRTRQHWCWVCSVHSSNYWLNWQDSQSSVKCCHDCLRRSQHNQWSFISSLPFLIEFFWILWISASRMHSSLNDVPSSAIKRGSGCFLLPPAAMQTRLTDNPERRWERYTIRTDT